MDENATAGVTMPRWPAWVLLATMVACAYPALRSNAPGVEGAPEPAAVIATAPAAAEAKTTTLAVAPVSNK